MTKFQLFLYISFAIAICGLIAVVSFATPTFADVQKDIDKTCNEKVIREHIVTLGEPYTSEQINELVSKIKYDRGC